MYLVKQSDGVEKEVEFAKNRIRSSANSHFVRIVDFRPFRLVSDGECKVYLEDNEESTEYMNEDVKFIENYIPSIQENYMEEEIVSDVKLPSGRWMECIKVSKKENGDVYFDALVDAYGTYNENN